MILSIKRKIIISIIFLFLIIFIIIYFIIVPAILDIMQIKKIINTQRIELERDYLKGQNLKQMLAQINEVKSQSAVLDKVFVEKNNGLEFIEILERTAKNNNITQKIDLFNYNFDEILNNNSYEKVSIQLLTTGDFIDQLNYLIDLETLNYYINIKILNIAFDTTLIKHDSPEENKTSNINMLIIADTYWE
ncbi:hypothetical protein KKA20_01415 [Patescibacteria group bacterium]|nr:hypothetical protein [Patescibacteria group bacterium]